MNKFILIGLIVALFCFVGSTSAASADVVSEQTVSGHSNGNHRLDCTIIRPWDSASGPRNTPYPVIVWANGWGGNDVAGDYTLDYYKPMLYEWVIDGPYIVIAANQWSVQESDVLACLQWLLDQNQQAGSPYQGLIDTDEIGLAGHSQGGGAVIKAGDGEPNGINITTVVAINPYGPSWLNSGGQDGPVLIIKGSEDFITFKNTNSLFEEIQTSDQGGVYAVRQGAGHNDLDLFQDVMKLWWQTILNDNAASCKSMKSILNTFPWTSTYAFTENFDLICQ